MYDYRDDYWGLDWGWAYDFEQPFNECLINGQVVRYDSCSSGTLEHGKKFYGDKYRHIGSGYITFHNGVRNEWKEEHHFFVLSDGGQIVNETK